jgi:hypothetical protein
MTTPITPPVCPGCDRPTAARQISKAMRWGCLTGDCPVVFLEDSWTPPPPDPAGTPRRSRREQSQEWPLPSLFAEEPILTHTQPMDTIPL